MTRCEQAREKRERPFPPCAAVARSSLEMLGHSNRRPRTNPINAFKETLTILTLTLRRASKERLKTTQNGSHSENTTTTHLGEQPPDDEEEPRRAARRVQHLGERVAGAYDSYFLVVKRAKSVCATASLRASASGLIWYVRLSVAA